jgi:hypothetical protein
MMSEEKSLSRGISDFVSKGLNTPRSRDDALLYERGSYRYYSMFGAEGGVQQVWMLRPRIQCAVNEQLALSDD